MIASNAEAYWPARRPGPVLVNLAPAVISPGQEITITGHTFGTDSSRANVYFYDVPATITSWSDTEIKVIAPSYFTSSINMIVVRGYFYYGTTYNGAYEYGDNYEYFSATIGYYQVKPVIEAVSLNDDNPYIQLVKIEGNYFGDVIKEVYFGDQKVSVANWDDNLINVVLPENSNAPITVKLSDDCFNTIEIHYFTQAAAVETDPAISISPKSVYPGQTFIIYGHNFSSDYTIKLIGSAGEYSVPGSQVKFGGSNLIEVTIPDNVSLNGHYDLYLMNGDSLVFQLDDALTVQAGQPAIASAVETVAEDATPAADDNVSVMEKYLVKAKDANLTKKLKGKILLQVESHGEAWYVHPTKEEKFYLKDGTAAYRMLREFGLGISNADLEKIPAEGSRQTGDVNLINRLKGHIILQVENHGEAWYVNPDDGHRYYLKDGAEAYRIMRELSLGIANDDLRKIEVGEI